MKDQTTNILVFVSIVIQLISSLIIQGHVKQARINTEYNNMLIQELQGYQPYDETLVENIE